MATKKLTVSYPWNRIELNFPWKGLLLPERANGQPDREPSVIASWSAAQNVLSLKAGTQKRQATGAAGGKGGQFARKEIAKDLPQPVKAATEMFSKMNRDRVGLAKAKKKLQKMIDGGASEAEIKVQNYRISTKQMEADNSKKNFKWFQKEAKKEGFQVNALGKWSNKKQLADDKERLKGEAKEARKELDAVLKDKDHAELTKKIDAQITDSQSKFFKVDDTLGKINDKALGIGFGRHDFVDWPQNLKNEYIVADKERNRLGALHLELAGKKDKLQEKQREKMMQVIAVNNPANVTIEYAGKMSKVRRNRVERGVSDFSRVVDDSLVKGKSLRVESGGRGRAYFNENTNTIGVTSSAGEKTISHEAGHWLEKANPSVHKKAVDFYNRRTQGQPLERLDGKGNALTPEQIRASKMKNASGYAEHEVTRPDDFIDKYMGKDYSVYNASGTMDSTEIISMGIEYMIKDPQDFATKDPDYFDFMYNTLRGN